MQIKRYQQGIEIRQAGAHWPFIADVGHAIAQQQRDSGDNHNSHQRRRHAFKHFGQQQHDGQRGGEQQPHQTRLAPDVRHLRKENQYSQRVNEADHHRARNIAHHARQPGKAENDLNHTAEDHRRQNVLHAMRVHHRSDHQRDGTGRRGDHRWPSSQNRQRQAQHHRSDKTDFRVDAGNHGERNHFRYQRQGGNHPGQALAGEKRG